MQTRQSDRTRPAKNYNSYREDFVVNSVDLEKIVEELVGLVEKPASQDIDIVDDQEKQWIDDRSKPEVEFDDQQQQLYEQELTNLRILERLMEVTSGRKETSVTIQNADRESKKYIKNDKENPSWAAQEGQLFIPASNLNIISGMRSTGKSTDVFVWVVGVGFTHTEKLLMTN